MFEELKQAWARARARKLESKIQQHSAERTKLRERQLKRVAEYEAAVAAASPVAAGGKAIVPPTVQLKAKANG